MGLMDTIQNAANPGGGEGGGQQNAIVQALIGMLTGGGASGLQSMLGNFRQAGMGGKVDSWVSTGQNQSISPEEVERGMGRGNLEEVARRANMSPEQAKGPLASILPSIVDRVTPNGQLPGNLDNISGLLGNLGGLGGLFGKK